MQKQVYITKLGTEILSCNERLTNAYKFLADELPVQHRAYLLSYTQVWRIIKKDSKIFVSVPDRSPYVIESKPLN